MNHLLVQLLGSHDLRFLGLVFLEAVLGSGLATTILILPRNERVGPVDKSLLFGIVITLTSWVSFLTALAGTYPHLSLVVPPSWALPSLVMSLVSGVGAGAIQQLGRRSARNALLCGSLLACGFSCMLFTGMAGVVRPFALSYDLTSVLVVMLVGSALFGFALWEGDRSAGRRSWAVGSALMVLAFSGLSIGSLAAILPFNGWMNALSQPDDLASSPVAIIIAAEAVAVLVFALSGSLVDNRVAARDQLETDRLRQLADCTLESILIHRDGLILDANQSLAVLLGVTSAELRDGLMARFLPADTDSSLWSSDRGAVPVETEILDRDGKRLPVEILSRAISYGGRPALVTALRDVSERRTSEARIHFLAHHDMLTELPNRVLLSERLDLALRLAVRTRAPFALLCLDLDGFKAVNDTLGHAAGDQVLCQVADRLRATTRDTDCVARIGGDEFVVLQQIGAKPEQAVILAQRIIASLKPAFHLDAGDVNVGTSIGIALYPQDGETASMLLRKGDIALYYAKTMNNGAFNLFQESMDIDLRDRRELEQDLRHAILANELTLAYQPLFDRNRRLIAFEALVRWTHPTRGAMSPGQFVPLAEECGLIIPLGEWVIRTACKEAAGWASDHRIAVNLSPAQFMRGNLQELISSVLAETGLAADRLELEITEGLLIDQTDHALHTLTEMRKLGTRLVLDDFGTGYSSLSYLQRFPFDKLKLDRSFVQRLAQDAASDAIVAAIIAMSHILNLEVTAEGVETVVQYQMLCAMGCHELQGFLLGRPMGQALVADYIREAAATPGLMPWLDSDVPQSPSFDARLEPVSLG